jgi:hypothetical protein
MAGNQILILRSGQSLTHPGAQMKIIDLQEARKTQRRPGLDMGLIMFGDISIGCVLRNVSEGGGSTRHRIASRHPGPIHIDRLTLEKNLFVQRHLAEGTSHRDSIYRPNENPPA